MARSASSVAGGGAVHGSVQTALTDVTRIFDLLESDNPEVVQEVKDLILENFNGTKENWLVSGLYEYYIQSGSSRCSDILCGISREPHDRYLIEKITEGIKSPVKETRKQALALLGYAVCKQPSWLYKIAQLSLIKDLIKLLKTETDVVLLLTGLLSIIMMLPIIPSYLVPYLYDLFDVFGRLATWSHTTAAPKEHLLHLQVGLYSLFHRLYAMFPCTFLSHLRIIFSSADKRTVFLHTIVPMLEKVKLHPSLITATRDVEANVNRWERKEYHDIIAECAKISLDVYESSLPEEVSLRFTAVNIGTHHQHHSSGEGDFSVEKIPSLDRIGEVNLEDVVKVPSSDLLCQAMGVSDLNSLVQFIDDFPNSAPPTPISVTTTSASASSSQSQAKDKEHTVKANLQAETAMEATPENTPIKEKDRLPFKFPPLPNTPGGPTSQFFGFNKPDIEVAKHLSSQRNDKQTDQTPPVTPHNCVPSSPGVVPANSSVSRKDSIFDNTPITFRREPTLMLQRLQKVHLEQQQIQQAAQAQLQQHQMDTISSNSSTASSTSQNQINQNHPVETSRKVAVVSPHTAEGPGPVATLDFTSQQENDKTAPVNIIGGGGPLTPVPGQSVSSSGVGLIDPVLSNINLDEESTGLEKCRSETCASGGLHMVDHKQMMAFARKVNNRLRYHSHCITVSDFNASVGPSPGTSPGSTNSYGVTVNNVRSRFMKRSMSCPDIKKPVIDDKEGNNKRPAMLPKLAETGYGSEDAKDVTDEVDDDDDDEQSLTPKEPDHPYEHLFQKILPSVLSFESKTLPSPHKLLDICLVKAASQQQSQNQMRGRTERDEILVLKGQIELLHGKLLFERYRRDCHAVRNRRLAGKCRQVVTQEEQTITMGQKIHNLEKEVASLKVEVTLQRNTGLNRERELQKTVEELETKLKKYKNDIVDLTKDKSQLESKYIRLQADFCRLDKDSDKKKADFFTLENEVKNCQKYIDRNKELKTAYECRLKDILLLGELLRKYKESLSLPSDYRYLLEQLDDYRMTSEEEVRKLSILLGSAKSQLEAANGTISDLRKGLEKREDIIEFEKKKAIDKELEHQQRMNGIESKYEAIKTTNQRLELEILSLQHQLSIKTLSTRPTRGRIDAASSPSNNGEVSPAGNSNHSDVDSATSASGFQMSPDRNICIFGSPQFDHPADRDEMRDLQKVLDFSTGGSGVHKNMRRNSSPLTPLSLSHNRDLGSFSRNGTTN